jgi:hypothetical protein
VSAAPEPRRLGRSFFALASGVVIGAVLSLGTDVVLHATGVFPPWGQPMTDALFALATAYRIAYTVLGCAVAAQLAPSRAMGHALILGVLGVVVNGAGAIATRGKGPEFGPMWYPVLLAATSIPCAWVGGWLVRKRPQQRRGIEAPAG